MGGLWWQNGIAQLTLNSPTLCTVVTPSGRSSSTLFCWAAACKSCIVMKRTCFWWHRVAELPEHMHTTNL